MLLFFAVVFCFFNNFYFCWVPSPFPPHSLLTLLPSLPVLLSLVWFGLVLFDLVWFGLAWLGLVWFGLVLLGLVWLGLGFCPILLLLFSFLRKIASLSVQLESVDTGALVSVHVGLSPRNSNRYILFVGQSGLNLRRYQYLEDSSFQIRSAYATIIAKALKLLVGVPVLSLPSSLWLTLSSLSISSSLSSPLSSST